MEQRDMPLTMKEQKAQFRQAAITHRHLAQTHKDIVRAIREPAGFLFLLLERSTVL